jgi:hypothetical protein
MPLIKWLRCAYGLCAEMVRHTPPIHKQLVMVTEGFVCRIKMIIIVRHIINVMTATIHDLGWNIEKATTKYIAKICKQIMVSNGELKRRMRAFEFAKTL